MGFFKQLLDSSLSGLRKPTPPTKRAGRPGTDIQGGFIRSIERNKLLVGRERYRTYSEILANVGIVGASVRFFLNVLARAQWKVEPSDVDNPQAVEIADRLRKALFEELATPFPRVVRRIAMARYWGFSWSEWTARRAEDGVIIFDDIEPRAQLTIERWDTDLESGKVLGVIQRTSQAGQEVYIPRSKSIYMVDDSINDSPEGLGLFRHIVSYAKQLERFEQLEGFGFDKDLRGIPVGRAPIAELRQEAASLTEDDGEVEALKDLEGLRDFIRLSAKEPQTGLLLDSKTYETEDEASRPSTTPQWDIELLSGDHAGLEAVAAAISRKERSIARVLGTESIMLGETGAGSLAMARDKTEQFAQIVDSTLQEEAATLDKDAIDPLMQLNGWPEELKPTLKPDKIQQRDVLEVAQALAEMARAGAVIQPGDPVIDAIRELLGLPLAPEIDLDLDLMIEDPKPSPARAGSAEASDREMDEESTDDVAQSSAEKRFVIEDGVAVAVQEYEPRRESRFACISYYGKAFTIPQRSRAAAEAQARFVNAESLAKKVGSDGGRSVYAELVTFRASGD